MNCSRTSRLAAALFLAAGLITGCADDLEKPTSAQVQLWIRPDVAGLEVGARVWIDGTLVVDSLTTRNLEYILPAGEHQIVVRQECVDVLPADTLIVPVIAGTPMDVDIYLQSRAASLSVTSEPSGLSIRHDGSETNRLTPTTFTCVEPGPHEVVVRPGNSVGFEISGDTLKTVDVGNAGNTEASFTFSHNPIPQFRGTLLELMTATLCPNCPVADHAAEEIAEDPFFDPEALQVIQLHVRWGGTDPFFNESINKRLTYYNEIGSSAPIAYFNGLDKTVGSSYPDIEALYRGKIMETYGQDGMVGLYWQRVRVEGNLLRGDLRCVTIEDLAGYDRPQLLAFYAKDSLTAQQDPFHAGPFDGVAREYAEKIDLKRSGIAGAGDWIDASVEFDLSPDGNHPSPAVRPVAFVQDSTTQEILQSRQAWIQVP